MVKYLAILLVLFLSIRTGAQSLSFEKIFGPPGANASGRSVKQLSDGSVYVAGYAYLDSIGGAEITLTKLNRYGEEIWNRYYGTVNHDYGLFLNSASDNRLVIIGSCDSSNATSDFFLLKTDTSGNPLFFKVYYDKSTNEALKYIEETTDKGFIACGYRTEKNVPDPKNDSYVVKFDSAGTIEWEYVTERPGNDYSDGIRQTEDGSYVATGDIYDNTVAKTDIYVYKLSAAGTPVWEVIIGDHWDNGCQALIITSEKDYFVVGESHVDSTYNFDVIMARVSADGTLKWVKFIAEPGTDAAFSVVENQSGHFVMTGYSNSNDPSGPIDAFIMEVDSNGNQLAKIYYGNSSLDAAFELIPSLDNGYLLAGTSFFNGSNYEYLVHCLQDELLAAESFSSGISTVKPYPQPATGHFRIHTDQSLKDATVRIIDLQGAVCYEKQFGILDNTPMEPGLKAGFYLLQISSDQGSFTGKLVIQ